MQAKLVQAKLACAKLSCAKLSCAKFIEKGCLASRGAELIILGPDLVGFPAMSLEGWPCVGWSCVGTVPCLSAHVSRRNFVWLLITMNELVAITPLS